MMWWPFASKYPEYCAADVDALEFDYIIVGVGATGGTAGCVLASRLSEDPDTSVLVLERGVANDTWLSRVPMISFNIYDPQFGAVTWNSEPLKHCDNRKVPLFTAEVLGGNSRINGTVYTRGSVADYDAWAAMGRTDWSYEKVLPYFVKAQTSISRPKSAYCGDSGPWITQLFSYSDLPFKVYQAVRKSVTAWGLSPIDDLNAPDAPCDGYGLFDLTIDKNRKRVSTLEAFLHKQLALERRENLTICTNAIVSQIQFSGDQAEHQAERVLFQYADRRSRTIFSAKVKKEVIVSSGTLGSPQVLLLSGIGSREHLEERGVEVVRDLPGVGSNLCDHMAVPITWEVPVVESLIHLVSSPWKGIMEFFKYLFGGTGLLSLPIQMLSIFIRSSSISNDTLQYIGHTPSRPMNVHGRLTTFNPEELLPDFELMPLAIGGTDDLEEHKLHFAKMGAFTFLTTLLRPKSRGTVRLASTNAHDRPKIDLNFMSDPADWPMIRKAIRVAMKLGKTMQTQGFPLIRGMIFPESEEDKDIDKFIMRRARSVYHWSSTCRMAPEFDNAPGVVTDDLRVHGVSNLRVCDASVFPQPICTHTQAPVVMVAEKCADMIKAANAKQPLSDWRR